MNRLESCFFACAIAALFSFTSAKAQVNPLSGITILSQADVNSSYQTDFGNFFVDAKLTEFWPHIRILASKLIVNRELYFRVGDSATRAEGLKMLIRSLDKAKPSWRLGFSNSQQQCNFSDVKPSDWYYEFIVTGLQANLISCLPNFRPNDPISRQEFSKIAYNALLIVDPSKSNVSITNTFTDSADFDPSLRPYAENLLVNHIVSGFPDGRFLPRNYISRGQIAKIMTNAFFPLESGLAFALPNVELPVNFLLEENRVHISSPSASFSDLENNMSNSGLTLNFNQYETYSPDVAHSAALMSVVAYEDDEKIRLFLARFGFELESPPYRGVLTNDGYSFFLAKRTTPNTFPVQTQYVLSIRGTANRQNIWTDFQFVPTSSCQDSVHGTLHAGFCDLAKTVWLRINGSPMQRHITEEDDNNFRSARLTIVGHSLGGAAAVIVHGMMTDDSYTKGNRNRSSQKIQTYTIGAPVSGYRDFVNQYSDQRIYRNRREEDLVPTVGAVSGVHIGQQYGYAHLFTSNPSAFACSGAEATIDSTGQLSGCYTSYGDKLFSPDYGYYGPDTPFPSPEILGRSFAEHSGLGYADILREFLGTAIGKDIQRKAVAKP